MLNKEYTAKNFELYFIMIDMELCVFLLYFNIPWLFACWQAMDCQLRLRAWLEFMTHQNFVCISVSRDLRVGKQWTVNLSLLH